MDGLTPEQEGLKAKIRTSAVIWGIVAGLIAALIGFWLMSSAGDILRWGIAVLLGGLVGFFVYRWSYNSGVAKAVCRNCGTAFGIREVDRREQVTGAEQRRKIEPLPPERNANKVTTWTEEKVEITAIDECFKCHNRTERKWTTTRDRDKVEEEVPVVRPAPARLANTPADGPSGPPPSPSPPPAPPKPPVS